MKNPWERLAEMVEGGPPCEDDLQEAASQLKPEFEKLVDRYVAGLIALTQSGHKGAQLKEPFAKLLSKLVVEVEETEGEDASDVVK